VTRRRTTTAVGLVDADWERSAEITVNGRRVVSGTELSIRGVPGRYRFVEHVRTPPGAEWITCLGKARAGEPVHFRSFHPDRVKTVHRVTKLRGAS